MAAWLGEQLLKSLISGAAGMAFNELAGAVTGKPPVDIAAGFESVVNAIKKAEEHIIEEVKRAIDEKDLQQQTSVIITAEQEVARSMHFCKQYNNDTEYKKDMARLYKERFKGIDYTMTQIHENLIGGTVNNSGGLLRSFPPMMDDLLESEHRIHSIDWYLGRIESYLARVIALQARGLALQVIMSSASAYPYDTMVDYQNTMWGRIKVQVEVLWQSMHPVVKQLKKSFLRPINSLEWWVIKTGDRYLDSTDPNWVRLETINPHPWRIVQNNDQISCFLDRWPGSPRMRGYDVWEEHGVDHWGNDKSKWVNDFSCVPDDSYPQENASSHVKKNMHIPFKIRPLKKRAKFKLGRPDGWSATPHWVWDSEFELVECLDRPRQDKQPNHFYTTDEDGEGVEKIGYKKLGIVGWVYTTWHQDCAPWYRLWLKTRENFYTADWNHYSKLKANGEHDEGIKFYMPANPLPDTNTLLRLVLNRPGGNDDHMYSLSPHGDGALEYKNEGACGYIFTKKVHDSVPLYVWFFEG